LVLKTIFTYPTTSELKIHIQLNFKSNLNCPFLLINLFTSHNQRHGSSSAQQNVGVRVASTLSIPRTEKLEMQAISGRLSAVLFVATHEMNLTYPRGYRGYSHSPECQRCPPFCLYRFSNYLLSERFSTKILHVFHVSHLHVCCFNTLVIIMKILPIYT
jgi:hypothetical protein